MALVVDNTTKVVTACGGPAGAAGASWKRFTFTPINPYATGGDPCDLAAAFPKGQILALSLPPLSANGACIPVFDATNKKMKLYTAPGTESGAVDRTAAVVVGSVLGY